MKIRIEVSGLADRRHSGVAKYTRLLCEALDKKSELHASYFNFLNRQIKPDININGKIEENLTFPLRVYAKLQSYRLAPPFDTFKPKVDLTIFPNFATWPTAKSKLKATVIHDLTYLFFPEVVETKNLAHLKRIIPRSIKQADFIITISESVKNELVQQLSLDPSRCLVTPIPPDETFYKKSSREVYQKYSIPTEKYIYFIGNFEPRKGLGTLIDAYRKLPKKVKDEYALVIAGSKGWKNEEITRSLASAASSGDKVTHIGYIDQQDSPALYQRASLVVMPSIYEGFGMPIVEAMASGVPVVASDIPVLRETGSDGALYAEVGNADDFSQKISQALTDDNLRQTLITNGRRRLRQLSWSDNADRIIEYANKLLK